MVRMIHARRVGVAAVVVVVLAPPGAATVVRPAV